MFWHVYHHAISCPELAKVVLATDDQRIKDAASKLNVPVVMTRSDHVSGTDRVLEAARAMDIEPGAVVVNIQGDEPCLNQAMLSQLVAPFADPEVRVATLASPMSTSQALSPDRVKVVLASNGDALYFSRAPIPYPRSNENDSGAGHLLHVGLYAFRMEALMVFSGLPQGKLERQEKLEQLRLLEVGIPIRVVITDHTCHGVDRPEDLEQAKKILLEQN